MNAKPSLSARLIRLPRPPRWIESSRRMLALAANRMMLRVASLSLNLEKAIMLFAFVAAIAFISTFAMPPRICFISARVIGTTPTTSCWLLSRYMPSV